MSHCDNYEILRVHPGPVFVDLFPGRRVSQDLHIELQWLIWLKFLKHWDPMLAAAGNAPEVAEAAMREHQLRIILGCW